jgi:hypothetical protein
MRSIRLFLILILRSSASRAFYALFAFFSVCLAAFSRESSSRAAVRLVAFLAFFFAVFCAFSFRVIACCNFLFAAVRCR